MDNASMKVAQAMINAARENGYFVEGEPLRSAPELAEMENETRENIGARRLQTILETLLEDVSFNASHENPLVEVVVDKNFVENILTSEFKSHDFKKFVL